MNYYLKKFNGGPGDEDNQWAIWIKGTYGDAPCLLFKTYPQALDCLKKMESRERDVNGLAILFAIVGVVLGVWILWQATKIDSLQQALKFSNSQAARCETIYTNPCDIDNTLPGCNVDKR